jgi:hypothetical protein
MNPFSIAVRIQAQHLGMMFLFGPIDLLLAITSATIYNAPVTMGPACWIPAFWVPLLLVTHYVTFIVLRRGRSF